MDIFQDSPILQGVKAITHAFAEQVIRPAAARHDAEESMPWDIMEQAANIGMAQTALIDTMSMDGPPEAQAATQGADAPPGKKKRRYGRQLAAVGSEELAWGCAGIMLAIGGSGLAASPVARMGTDLQKKLFKDCLTGKDEHGHVKVAAMALSEPATGSDISALKTTGVKDGEHWVLNGSKQWITNGKSAAVFVVWAQCDPSLGRGGVRGFVVPRGTPGLIPGRKEIKLGIRASETAQVILEDCRVPVEWMLGSSVPAGAQEGLSGTKKMLDATRPVVAAQAVGIAQAAYEHVLKRVQSSSLHGTPMAGHQHLAFALAEMEMEISASRLLVHRAAWMADQDLENVKWASMAKAHAARTAQEVTTRAMVMLGEEALEPGHPVEKWYRDAKIYDIFEGTGQIQRRIVAKELLGLNAT